MVTGLVLLFAFTAGAVIWLARDVNRSVSNRTAAQSIAFQSARSGAQQIDIVVLRDGPSDGDRSRPAPARRRGGRGALFDGYALDGRVTAIDISSTGHSDPRGRVGRPNRDLRRIVEGATRADDCSACFRVVRSIPPKVTARRLIGRTGGS